MWIGNTEGGCRVNLRPDLILLGSNKRATQYPQIAAHIPCVPYLFAKNYPLSFGEIVKRRVPMLGFMSKSKGGIRACFEILYFRAVVGLGPGRFRASKLCIKQSQSALHGNVLPYRC